MSENVFFVVWNAAHGVPRVKHCSLANAKFEAKRLAREHPGQKFAVLMSCGHAEKQDVEWIEYDEIPF